jgi:hypothetical protein
MAETPVSIVDDQEFAAFRKFRNSGRPPKYKSGGSPEIPELYDLSGDSKHVRATGKDVWTGHLQN